MKAINGSILYKVVIVFATLFFSVKADGAAIGPLPVAVSDSLSERMASETVAFLEGMPAGLQESQAEAVRRASAGCYDALRTVRNSRNVAPELPEGIVVSEIGTSMKMFRSAAGEGSVRQVLLYLHGGGWCFGSINSCARYCAALAAESDIAVIALDYPLAPENPYPAALNACAEAFDYLVSHADSLGIDPRRISVGGDSAGGNLALALALAKGENGADSQPIRSLVLFYPVVYAGDDGSDSWRAFGEGYGLDSSLMDAFNSAYIGGAGVEDPLISPIFATDESLRTLPPVLMVNAERDILLDQCNRMAARMKAAGCSLRREILPSTVHLFITVPGQPTAFRTAVTLSADFLRGE